MISHVKRLTRLFMFFLKFFFEHNALSSSIDLYPIKNISEDRPQDLNVLFIPANETIGGLIGFVTCFRKSRRIAPVGPVELVGRPSASVLVCLVSDPADLMDPGILSLKPSDLIFPL